MVRRFLLCSLLCLLTLNVCAMAKDTEQTQFGRDIRIEAGQKVGDVTCINCWVYIAGESSGEVTAIHGNVVLGAGASVAGEVTAVWGGRARAIGIEHCWRSHRPRGFGAAKPRK
jgi:hypothetical protein